MQHMSRRQAVSLLGATGCVVLSSAGLATAEEDDQDADRWRAWAVTKGENTRLVVEGIYNQGGPGLVVLVTKADPQGINPKILLLDLKTATLPGIWPAVLQPVPAYYAEEPYKSGQYTSVQIRYPDGDTVPVDKITDAGAGPT